MSSKEYATPLRIEVRANPLLRRLYLGMSGSAVLTLLLLPLPLPINFLAVMVLLLFTTRVWQRRAELGGRPVTLVWDSEQQWWWQDEYEYAVELCGDSYLATRLAVLNYRISGSASRAVVLTPKGIGEELFRRMRVRFQITPANSSPG